MQLLDHEILRRQIPYTCLACTDAYRIWSLDINGAIRYEVHRRRFAPTSTVTYGTKDVVRPERELFATDEEFGRYAWAYQELQDAMDKAITLEPHASFVLLQNYLCRVA